MLGEQAVADLAVGGQPGAVARRAERVRDRGDDADLAAAAVDIPQLAQVPNRAARGPVVRSKWRLQDGQHVVGGDGLAALPLVAGVQGHLFDDAQLVSVVEAEPKQRRRRRPAR